MIRTLIFGAIAGYVGKKLYDEGKLTDFKNDLTARLNLDPDPAAPATTAATTPGVSVN
jgi:hypothetical protein